MMKQTANFSRKLGAQRALGIVFTVLINVLLYLMVDGLFAVDVVLSHAKVLS